ncbi:hypothetical protein CTAYLR_004931 [Chrysophaeum taylorii]|uniref:Uncharacterized protein n=1 Tax=Chrysophaeum taylorii TaxID=2483200 RepID=A0AAD7XND5_9STRA|nr:hypothetical protein CTAYLR_004931 [Chrysophaeum taylorii]
MGGGYEPIGDSRQRTTGVAAFALAAAVVLLVANASLLRWPVLRRRSITSVGEKERVGDPSALDFELYKIALSSRVGDSNLIREFVNETIAPMDPNFDLGCGGVKINAYLLPYGPQLHWVESSILSDDPAPIEDWQTYFETVNGGLSEFNAFMHNKISMFTTNLAGPLAILRQRDVSMLLRRSTGYTTGAASPVGEVAHVVFSISGRAYEFLAPIAGNLIRETRDWPEWDDTLECPPAHRLDENLDEYSTTYEAYVDDASSLMSAWKRERGYFPPMLAHVGVAIVEEDLTLVRHGLFDDLSSIAGIHAYEEYATDDAGDCVVYRIPTVSSKGFRAPVRYVINPAASRELAARGHGRSVAEYNQYIHSIHERTAAAYDDWEGWDHWLDQHIGLKYVGHRNEAVARMLNDNLTSVAVGQRTTADYGQEKAVHWYTGYRGSISWEYWVTGCSEFSTNGEADVCACISANNDALFAAEFGTNCTGLGDWYENG